MSAEASPRPWRVNGHSIEANDPDGLWLQNEKTGRGVVANLPSCPKSRMSVKNRKTWDAIVEANARLIVDAVNERDDLVENLKTANENRERENAVWASLVKELKAERDRAVKYAEAAPHPGSASWKEMQAVYAERDRLRDIIKRLITVREKVFWRKDEKTGLMYETCLMDEDEARKTIEEAKAAIKEDKE